MEQAPGWTLNVAERIHLFIEGEAMGEYLLVRGTSSSSSCCEQGALKPAAVLITALHGIEAERFVSAMQLQGLTKNLSSAQA
jgi:hypothetical protein